MPQLKIYNFLWIFLFFFYSPLLKGEERKYRADETPHELKDLSIKERLGESIDLSLSFTDEENQAVKLSKYFNSQPVLMSIIYYNCPSLCNFHMNGLFEGLNELNSYWKENYQILFLSMDSTEKSPLAKEKKINYLKEFKEMRGENIHFLTSSSVNIKKLSDQLGFAFRWDDETQQFAHSPVAYTLSPKGVISRYLYGIQFEAQNLKLSLLEAGKGKIGNMVDRILLFCYRFNPKKNKYTLYATNIMKAGGILIILALISLLVPAWIKERKQHS